MILPRILLTAPKSGSGKTLITCGILNLFKRRGIRAASFKCGPDYIDPMFHTKVIGTNSTNLDTFFAGPDTVRHLLKKHGADSRIAVIEGVMGYYDGLGGVSTRSSAYEVAAVTETPVVLLVDARGASVSLGALVAGFARYREDSRIRGVILNRISPMMYPRMKELIESETGVAVLGFVPVIEDCVLESRHLGLMLPEEVEQLQEKLDHLSGELEKSLDVEGILALADSAGEIEYDPENVSVSKWRKKERVFRRRDGKRLRIGLADDEAFCFFYKDNLELLEEMGAELIPFSPIHDECLPENLDGLLLHGGYPELFAKSLFENSGMRESIRREIAGGLPTIAECGGFMYLHGEMEDMGGKSWPMAGVIPGRAFRTNHLNRFGYINLEGGTVFGVDVGSIPAHEFHYFDSENCGDAFRAGKPVGGREWKCMHSRETLLAGFPHLYYYGNPGIAESFLRRCEERCVR